MCAAKPAAALAPTSISRPQVLGRAGPMWWHVDLGPALAKQNQTRNISTESKFGGSADGLVGARHQARDGQGHNPARLPQRSGAERNGGGAIGPASLSERGKPRF